MRPAANVPVLHKGTRHTGFLRHDKIQLEFRAHASQLTLGQAASLAQEGLPTVPAGKVTFQAKVPPAAGLLAPESRAFVSAEPVRPCDTGSISQGWGQPDTGPPTVHSGGQAHRARGTTWGCSAPGQGLTQGAGSNRLHTGSSSSPRHCSAALTNRPGSHWHCASSCVSVGLPRVSCLVMAMHRTMLEDTVLTGSPMPLLHAASVACLPCSCVHTVLCHVPFPTPKGH